MTKYAVNAGPIAPGLPGHVSSALGSCNYGAQTQKAGIPSTISKPDTLSREQTRPTSRYSTMGKQKTACRSVSEERCSDLKRIIGPRPVR